jgi:hypothetical protein
MDTIGFYLGAVLLCVLGSLCMRNTSPYTRAGGEKFEKRGKRRLLGQLLLVIAGLCLGVAIITQLASMP